VFIAPSDSFSEVENLKGRNEDCQKSVSNHSLKPSHIQSLRSASSRLTTQHTSPVRVCSPGFSPSRRSFSSNPSLTSQSIVLPKRYSPDASTDILRDGEMPLIQQPSKPNDGDNSFFDISPNVQFLSMFESSQHTSSIADKSRPVSAVVCSIQPSSSYESNQQPSPTLGKPHPVSVITCDTQPISLCDSNQQSSQIVGRSRPRPKRPSQHPVSEAKNDLLKNEVIQKESRCPTEGRKQVMTGELNNAVTNNRDSFGMDVSGSIYKPKRVMRNNYISYSVINDIVGCISRSPLKVKSFTVKEVFFTFFLFFF
jgi:hypothetical protein